MAKNNNEVPINGLYDDEGRILDEQVAGNRGESETEAAEEAVEVSLSKEELAALCKESVCPECDVFKEAETIRLRALADSENVKKRLLRETEELKKYAGESILADLLPILDNLDLALAHTDNLSAECKNFVVGVDMTRKIFLDAVKKPRIGSGAGRCRRRVRPRNPRGRGHRGRGVAEKQPDRPGGPERLPAQGAAAASGQGHGQQAVGFLTSRPLQGPTRDY